MLNITKTQTDITLEKDEKVIVIESSDEEVEHRRKRKRKPTTNMDEINKNFPKKN